MTETLPAYQYAVQITAPETVTLTTAKPVHLPGPHQILCQVEAAGLCFSDLKLMSQFDAHPRKAAIKEGIAPSALAEIPGYVPGNLAVVPGHEAVVRVCRVGPGVQRYRTGDRFLVQSDYRWLKTEGSNAAVGYNFEGALQEYLLFDERVTVSPEGEDMMLPASGKMPASAIALIEPWACVENAYAEKQRRAPLAGGEMLVVAETPGAAGDLEKLLRRGERPARLTWVGPNPPRELAGIPVINSSSIEALPPQTYSDIICLGASAESIEAAFRALANRGLLVLVLKGHTLSRPVVCPVGRVHYGGIRIVGAGDDPAAAYDSIPATSEVRPDSRVHVLGAGGPMGVMHVVRVLCAGIAGLSVVGTDTDKTRLAALHRIAAPMAEQRGFSLSLALATEAELTEGFDYTSIMAPVPTLVNQAIHTARPRGLINIFAGIPAHVEAELDLQAYLSKQAYFIGTSGSVLQDMRTVLARVEGGALDTNVSVAAISGMAGAADGLQAVGDRSIAGKIVVYPWCHELGLIRLEDLTATMPEVAEALQDGTGWTAEAERRLAARYGYHTLA